MSCPSTMKLSVQYNFFELHERNTFFQNFILYFTSGLSLGLTLNYVLPTIYDFKIF